MDNIRFNNIKINHTNIDFVINKKYKHILLYFIEKNSIVLYLIFIINIYNVWDLYKSVSTFKFDPFHIPPLYNFIPEISNTIWLIRIVMTTIVLVIYYVYYPTTVVYIFPGHNILSLLPKRPHNADNNNGRLRNNNLWVLSRYFSTKNTKNIDIIF